MACTLAPGHARKYLEILRYRAEHPYPSPYAPGERPSFVLAEGLAPETGIGDILESPKTVQLAGRNYLLTVLAGVEVLPDGRMLVSPQENYRDLGPVQ